MLAEIAARANVPVIAYGFYPTFAAEHLMRAYPFIEAVIRGEPEMTFLISVRAGGRVLIRAVLRALCGGGKGNAW